MTRRSVGRALVTSALTLGLGCGEQPDDVEMTSSAAVTTVTSAVRGYTRPGNQQSIVYRDQCCQIKQHRGTPPGLPFNLGGSASAGASPWGYKRSDNADAVLFVDENRNVTEIIVPSSGPVTVTNFALYGAPAADLDTPNLPDVIGYVRSDNRSAVVYRSGGEIIEILSNFGQTPKWQVSSLTVRSGTAMRVGKGSAFPYVRTDGVNDIIYVGTDNHIREMWKQGSAEWAEGDLSVAVGDVSAAASSPWGYQRSDGYNAVVFVDTAGYLREFALKPGSPCTPTFSWCAGPLPANGASQAFRPSGYARGDGINTVVYRTETNKIRELALVSGAWQDSQFVLPANVEADSEPFGVRPPVGLGSVLFKGKNLVNGNVQAVQLYLPNSSGWTQTVL